MKTVLHKALAWLLCVSLCASLFPVSFAWADAADDGESASAVNEMTEAESFEAARGVIINAENFPDPVFRAYVEENCDSDGDLVLTHREITAITEMDVHGLGIESLAGIWYFPELVTLNCSENKLRELDVSDLPCLERLYCQDNLVTTEEVEMAEETVSYDHGLEFLVPSRALKVLWCYNNNLSGEELNLQFCEDLEYLDCSNNPINTLDLSGVPHLQELRCNNAGLEALNLSCTPELCVLWCWTDYVRLSGYHTVRNFNLIEYLDLSVCPKLARVVAFGSRENYTCNIAFYDGESEVSVSNSTPATLYLGEYGEVTIPDASSSASALENLFPDPNFRAFVAETIDTDQDNVLSYDERNAVEIIDCADRQIYSLEGLNLFTSLQELYCDNNFLTSLDIHSNTGLTILSCCNNQLTQLDVSKNSQLKKLICEKNSLTALDVSNNTELWYLNCVDNSIASLEVDNCPKLAECVCFGSYETNGTSDAYIQYYYFKPFTNGAEANAQMIGKIIRAFVALDSSVSLYAGLPINTARFPDDAFRAYVLNTIDTNEDTILSNREMRDAKNIDCSGTQAEPGSIEDLTGIELFPNLTALGCSYNALTEIDLSGNPNLAQLVCDGNPLTGLDLSANPQLSTLSCENCGLRALDVTGNAALVTLYCSGNQLTALDLHANKELRSLYCTDNSLQSLNINACNYLQKAVQQGTCTVENGAREYYYALTYAENQNGYNYEVTTKCILYVDDGVQVSMDAAVVSLNTTFPDVKFRQYVKENIDVNHNNQLSATERRNVTALDVSNLGIEDLTGVEVFTELKTLNCSGNALTQLDVSKLTKLEVLYCQNNNLYNIIWLANTMEADPDSIVGEEQPETELSEAESFNAPVTSGGIGKLKLGSAPLKVLWCYDNQLTALNLGSCRTLENLDCAFNWLETLDVSGLPNLRVLMCHDNNLGALNVSANHELAYLWCWNNLFEDLDISMCPMLVGAVTNGSIENMNDHVSLFNDEAELSVSPYTALYWGQVSEGGVPINDAFFPDPNFRAFVRISVDSNYDGILSYDEIDATDYLDCTGWQIASLEGVNYFTELRYLSCRNNQLTELDVSGLADLEVLDCSYNAITYLNVNGNTLLKRLRAQSNQLSDLNLSTNGQLQVLWCWYNHIETLDLTACPTLSMLAMYGTEEIYSGGYIEYYDEDGNYHEEPLPDYICRFDKSGISDLSTDANVQFIATLVIEINETNFPDQNFRTFVRNLAFGATTIDQPWLSEITELDCSGMGIADLKGIEYFFALSVLDCSNNSLKTLDISALGTLTELDCSHNALTGFDTSRNPALRKLDCSYNKLSTVTFSNNYVMEQLDCSHNKLTEINLVDCDTITYLINTGVEARVKNGVRTYSGSLQREDGLMHQILFSYDNGVFLLTNTYPIPDLIVPENLVTIGEEAFAGGAFTCVFLSEQTLFVDKNAFAGCPNLICIYVPNRNTKIDPHAFDYTQDVTLIGLENSTASAYAEQYGFAFLLMA